MVVITLTEKSHSSNGWLQLELRINSIPLKKGMTTSACFKETSVLLKILDHCKRPPEKMTVVLKCMAASASLKEQYALNKKICQIHWIYEIYGCKYHIL